MTKKAFDQIKQGLDEALAFARGEPTDAKLHVGGLMAFVRESNRIEGILRDPTEVEVAAHERLLALPQLDLTVVTVFQAIIAPDKPMRSTKGMNVRVGNHVAPQGGPEIVKELMGIIEEVIVSTDPWGCHIRFETLHPFMDGNGRTGRAVWAWQMQKMGRDPFVLPFLHRWYYQTLEVSRVPPV